MKKILLTVVLGVAGARWHRALRRQLRDNRTPPPGPGGWPGSRGPVIKDPAEYNAYVAAVQQ